jgi:2-dehydropantoate 2-reductase
MFGDEFLMNALLYGSGAVGIAIAAALLDCDWKVDIKATGKTKDSICKNGIKRKGLFKEIYFAPEMLEVFESLADINQANYDYILICTKTINNEINAEDIYLNKHILKQNGKIVIMQNGWGNDEPYLKYFPKSTIYYARVITGFTRPERYISEVTVHASPILIGSLYDQPVESVIPLAEAINRGGIPCEVTHEIEKALWAKMLYNCTLNPLGAVLRVNYGRLKESENSIFIMNKIIEEIYKVMKRGGYHTYWNDAEEYKKVFYQELIPTTYNHKSSTLQDIEKRNKTEIDSLTGSIVKLGAKFNIEVPYNTMMYYLIKAIENFY